MSESAQSAVADAEGLAVVDGEADGDPDGLPLKLGVLVGDPEATGFEPLSSPGQNITTRMIKATTIANPTSRRRRQYTSGGSGPTGCSRLVTRPR